MKSNMWNISTLILQLDLKTYKKKKSEIYVRKPHGTSQQLLMLSCIQYSVLSRLKSTLIGRESSPHPCEGRRTDGLDGLTLMLWKNTLKNPLRKFDILKKFIFRMGKVRQYQR